MGITCFPAELNLNLLCGAHINCNSCTGLPKIIQIYGQLLLEIFFYFINFFNDQSLIIKKCQKNVQHTHYCCCKTNIFADIVSRVWLLLRLAKPRDFDPSPHQKKLIKERKKNPLLDWNIVFISKLRGFNKG